MLSYMQWNEMLKGLRYQQKFYAIYDMRVNPPGFNFAEFLALAEFLRKEIGGHFYKPPQEMVVVLVFKNDGGMARVGEGMPYSDEYAQKVLRNVMRPMVKLVPSVVELIEMMGEEADRRFPYAKDEQNEIGLARHPDRSASFGLGCHTAGVENLFYLSHTGNIKTFVADHSLCPIDPDTITMTMRQAPHLPQRNNDKVEWMKAKAALEADGHPVIVIDEYEDLLKRAAMYSQAKLNIGNFGGTCTMLVCLDVPYLLMKPNAHHTVHFKPGDHWPKARADQRVAWGPDNKGADTAENMLTYIGAKELELVHG